MTRDDFPTAGPPSIRTLKGVGPGALVDDSLEEAKLHEADVRAEPAADTAVGNCSVL